MKYFFTDCEGPLTKNDNAYELTVDYLPQGDRFYRQLSTYDDILAYLIKKPGYNAGGTLKLILPFFKAYGLTNKKIEKFSQKNFVLVPGIIPAMEFLQKRMPCFIVSTSYRPYIRAFSKVIGLPEKNTYATEIDLDTLKVEEKEKRRLKNYAREIGNLPELELPAGAIRFSQLPEKIKKSVNRLNQIFWVEINNLPSGKLFKAVKPIGGKEKAEAIRQQLAKNKKPITGLKDVIYIGDSITDRQAFQVVRKNGGLTISFNGNRYAIETAEIAVISKNAYILALFGDLFNRFGTEKVRALAKNWDRQKLEKIVTPQLLDKISAEVFLITTKNKEAIIKRSERFRKIFRGEKIGKIS